jgi:hypothetical protein
MPVVEQDRGDNSWPLLDASTLARLSDDLRPIALSELPEPYEDGATLP